MLPRQVVDTAAFHDVVGGWQQLVLGDTATGLSRLEDGLERIAGAPGMSGGPWREYAEVLMTMPSRRDQAIRILRWQTAHIAVNSGQSFLSLARATGVGRRRCGRARRVAACAPPLAPR